MVTTRPRRALRWAAVALALGALGASGCAARSEPPPATVTVKVPVPEPVYCPAAAPARPRLPIAALTASSPPADTIRAYAATVVLLKGAVEQLDGILAGCSRAPAAAPGFAPKGRSIARTASSR